MEHRLRRITVADLVGPLEVVALVDLSDGELADRGIALDLCGFWDGLGDFSGAYVEIPSGEQFLLRRFRFVPDDHRPNSLDVLGLIERDADEQLTRLLDALAVERGRVHWQTKPDAWLYLQRLLEKTRAAERGSE